MASGPSLEDRRLAGERPQGHIVMHQKWRNLLFLHWEVSAAEIQATLPEGLTVDTFAGKAYLGLVPFYMRDIRPRFLPAVPGISNFLEMNVRTYVYDKDHRPGVWFYSLDANQFLAVVLARALFHLPYHRAAMSAEHRNGAIHYGCRRLRDTEIRDSTFAYRGGAALPAPEPGSLDYFLLERYYLFSCDTARGRVLSGQVHHRPYPVCETTVETWSTTALQQAGFEVAAQIPVHAAFSPGVDVEIFAIRALLGR